MQTYYAACRRTNKQDGTSVTFALVVLVKYNPRDKEGYTLGWKDMSEDMGPCAAECPLSILALLDPVEEGSYAKAWRDRVHAYHARRRKRPKPGDIFTLATPLTFVDGSVEHRFKTIRVGHRKIRYRGLTTGGLYRIGSIERFDLTIEPPSS